ncbi:hypothetical protein VTK26DRAFT_1433 [Humicola hyalothermophila]
MVVVVSKEEESSRKKESERSIYTSRSLSAKSAPCITRRISFLSGGKCILRLVRYRGRGEGTFASALNLAKKFTVGVAYQFRRKLTTAELLKVLACCSHSQCFIDGIVERLNHILCCDSSWNMHCDADSPKQTGSSCINNSYQDDDDRKGISKMKLAAAAEHSMEICTMFNSQLRG